MRKNEIYKKVLDAKLNVYHNLYHQRPFDIIRGFKIYKWHNKKENKRGFRVMVDCHEKSIRSRLYPSIESAKDGLFKYIVGDK